MTSEHDKPALPIIGIVGGIGSGKSTVARELESMGCLVSDSDRDARAAFEDETIRAELVRWWGSDIIDPSGAIDRSRIARIVFADSEELRRLEGLTHPWIERRRLARFATAGPDTVALVIDAPLLIEAGLDAECDAVIFVRTPFESRLERVRRARGWDEAELKRREESQRLLDDKEQRADYVVENKGEPSELNARVREVLESIIESKRTKGSGIAVEPHDGS